ncbi:hypothetical protein [Zavarzinia compransoris]|uniref:Lipoprotein n=1 Tax=Zavarzinia compransoris TaxID=1264899 RepID=A0A317ECE8_9PROT|nr:hypothetical protein [Zavarzinia compransoris]PWR23946.1 hypothetical protein DKG75_05190 [Zavarzinia compransoris]TDP48193.1 hypothetical protein DES42_102496 [Zavarzinia compransoris]
MSSTRVALVALTVALGLQACSMFGKPEQAATAPAAGPQPEPVAVAAAEPLVTGPVMPGGPPMPSRKPTAAAGATIAAPRPALPAVPVAPGAPRIGPGTQIQADTVAPKGCRKPAELAADDVRRLQTELMVAALRCHKDADLKIADKYNSFVRKFSDEMVAQTKTLQVLFKREYGGSHMKQFDIYVTALANEISQRSQRTPSYCKQVADLLDQVNAVKPKEIATFSSQAPVIVRTSLTTACKA